MGVLKGLLENFDFEEWLDEGTVLWVYMIASCREANVQEADRILKSKCPGLDLGDNICLVKFVVWIPLRSLW